MTRDHGGVDGIIGSVVTSSKTVFAEVKPEAIRRFLASRPGIVGDVSITEVRGGGERAGASSGIVLFTAELDDGTGRARRDLVLRYDPQSAQRLFHEYDLAAQDRVQKALATTDVPVATPLWIDPEGAELGTPGFVMERVDGVVSSASPFTSGILGEASPERRRRMLVNVLDALVRIHRVDWKALGLEGFVKRADGDSPIARFIEWFWKTWRWVDSPGGERLEPVRKWLLDHRPSCPDVLMHGDPNLANYMFRDEEVVAVLDWELSSLGHAGLDVAIQILTMEFFGEMAGGAPEGVPTGPEWIDLYQQKSGQPLSAMEYFEKLASFMCIVVFASQNRNLPPGVREAQAQLAEFFWQKVA